MHRYTVITLPSLLNVCMCVFFLRYYTNVYKARGAFIALKSSPVILWGSLLYWCLFWEPKIGWCTFLVVVFPGVLIIDYKRYNFTSEQTNRLKISAGVCEGAECCEKYIAGLLKHSWFKQVKFVVFTCYKSCLSWEQQFISYYIFYYLLFI